MVTYKVKPAFAEQNKKNIKIFLKTLLRLIHQNFIIVSAQKMTT